MDANLSLVQIQPQKTVYRYSRHECYSIAYSDPQLRDALDTDTILTLIYNLQFKKHSWMESLSPSPTRFYHISKWHL